MSGRWKEIKKKISGETFSLLWPHSTLSNLVIWSNFSGALNHYWFKKDVFLIEIFFSTFFGMEVMPFPYGTIKWNLSEIGLMLANSSIYNIDMYAEQCSLLDCKLFN